MIELINTLSNLSSYWINIINKKPPKSEAKGQDGLKMSCKNNILSW